MSARLGSLAAVCVFGIGLGVFALVQVNAQQASRPPDIFSPPLGPPPSPAPVTYGPGSAQGSSRVVFQPIRAVASSGIVVSANGAVIAIADDDSDPGNFSAPAAPTAAQPGVPPASIPTFIASPIARTSPTSVPTVRVSPVPPTANPPQATPSTVLQPAAPTSAPRQYTVRTIETRTGNVIGTTKARPDQMALSPDGNWLAVVEITAPRLVDGILVSYSTVQLYGRDLQQKTTIIPESQRLSSVVSLAWTPDGSVLLINSRMERNNGVLFSWSLGSSRLSIAFQVDLGQSPAPTPSLLPGAPTTQTFSNISSAFLGQSLPGTNKLLIQYSALPAGESRLQSRLVALNLSTGETETLWENAGVFMDGRPSPDGRKIAYLQSTGEGQPPEAWVSNLDGTSAEKIAESGSRIMCWSADSRNVVVHRNGWTAAPRNNTAIVVRGLDSKQDRVVVSVVDTEAINSAWCSPASQEILLVKGNHGNWQVLSAAYQ